MPRSVLALDPALNNFGYCYPDGVVTTFKPHDKDRRIRLAEHYRKIMLVCEEYMPDMVVMEGPSYGSTRYVHTTVQLGELRGVILLATVLKRLPLIEVAPKSLKKFATNNGNAKKDEMLKYAQDESPIPIRDDNQADAFWLRQMALARYDEAEVNVYDHRLFAIQDLPWPN